MTRRAAPPTVLLGALIAAAPIAMDSYLPSLPSMATALATTPQAVQLTLSAYMYAWGIAQLFAGPMSDRFGRRPALLGGLAVFVAASAACALATSIDTLIAARAAQGFAIAAIAVVPRAVVRDVYAGDDAAHVLSLMGMVLGVAPIAAPLAGAELHLRFGWQANFVFAAGYGALLLLFVHRALPETIRARDLRATRPAALAANFRRLLRSRRFVGYTLVAALSQSALFAFLAGSAFVFVRVLDAGERGYAGLFGTVMLGALIGATVGTRVVRRMGIDAMIAASTWVMAGAAALLAALAWAGVAQPAAVVAPMFVFMGAYMMAMPQATAGALTPFPAIAGAAASLLSFIQFVTAATSAYVVGATFDGTARPMATAIAVTALAAFVAFRALVARR